MNKTPWETEVQHTITTEDALLQIASARANLEAQYSSGETVLKDGDDELGTPLTTDTRQEYNLWASIVRSYERLTKQLVKLPENPDTTELTAAAETGLRLARAKANALAYRARKSREAPSQQ